VLSLSVLRDRLDDASAQHDDDPRRDEVHQLQVVADDDGEAERS
jgi:hypothetical protein